jgi:hypothetical protein
MSGIAVQTGISAIVRAEIAVAVIATVGGIIAVDAIHDIQHIVTISAVDDVSARTAIEIVPAVAAAHGIQSISTGTLQLTAPCHWRILQALRVAGSFRSSSSSCSARRCFRYTGRFKIGT